MCVVSMCIVERPRSPNKSVILIYACHKLPKLLLAPLDFGYHKVMLIRRNPFWSFYTIDSNVAVIKLLHMFDVLQNVIYMCITEVCMLEYME